MSRTGSGRVGPACARALQRIVRAQPRMQRQHAADLWALQLATNANTVKAALAMLLRDRERVHERLMEARGPVAAGELLGRVDWLLR